MITAAGVGSGLDIESIITQLMTLERVPLQRLEQSKSDIQLDISANGQLRAGIARLQGAASGLADRDSLTSVSASSTDEDVLTVSASADADIQSHDIEVLKLATYDRLASNAYADENTAIGTGTLDISIGSDTLSLTLDGSNNTLAQIRDAINASADNPGVTASVITVDAGSQLMLTADESGLANAITVTPGGGLAGFGTTQVGTLQDAQLRIDGFDLSSASNTVTGAVNGVTLELASVGTASVSFRGDSSLLTSAVEEFSSAFNALRGTMRALSLTSMSGDSVLLGLERALGQRLSDPVALDDGSTGYLFELGLSFNDQGNLAFDAARLQESVAADSERVLELMGGDDGLGAVLDGFLDGYVADGGILDTRVESLNSRDRTLDRQISSAEFRLEKTEERLREQFTSLDTLLAQLSVTSDFLTQQLGALSGSSDG